MEQEIAAMPGVEAVGITQNIHLNPLSIQSTSIQVDGHQPPEGQLGFTIDQTRVNGGFFAAAGLTLQQGRSFERTDVEGGERVVVINDALARRFWPDGTALGRTFDMDGDRVRVVGIVNTARIRTIGEEPRPFIYRPYSQDYSTYVMLVVRLRGNAERFTNDLVQRIRTGDPDVVLIEQNTLARHVAAHVLPARLGALVFALFAALALTLALVGIYGVVSYSVAQRTREVGIRMSLGADPGAVVRLLVRDGLALVVVGALVGLGLSLAAGQLLSRFLFGVQPFDPLTLTLVPLLIAGIGAVAALLPAWRASRMAPARVLTVN
jgi:predicted permease